MAKPEFFTENGTVKPITPRKPKNRGVVVAVSLTLAVSASSAGTAAAVSASGDVTVSTNAGRASSGNKGNARSRGRDQTGQDVVRRLERRGLRVDQRGESFSTDCAAHSYGQVQQFFQEHPCNALFRALYEVRGAGGARVLVAAAWVDMPDAAGAAALKSLVDRPGTGNITELSKEQRRYRSVRFTGQHYASLQDGATVINAQAEPLGDTATAASLAQTAAREIS